MGLLLKHFKREKRTTAGEVFTNRKRREENTNDLTRQAQTFDWKYYRFKRKTDTSMAIKKKLRGSIYIKHSFQPGEQQCQLPGTISLLSNMVGPFVNIWTTIRYISAILS